MQHWAAISIKSPGSSLTGLWSAALSTSTLRASCFILPFFFSRIAVLGLEHAHLRRCRCGLQGRGRLLSRGHASRRWPQEGRSRWRGVTLLLRLGGAGTSTVLAEVACTSSKRTLRRLHRLEVCSSQLRLHRLELSLAGPGCGTKGALCCCRGCSLCGIVHARLLLVATVGISIWWEEVRVVAPWHALTAVPCRGDSCGVHLHRLHVSRSLHCVGLPERLCLLWRVQPLQRLVLEEGGGVPLCAGCWRRCRLACHCCRRQRRCCAPGHGGGGACA
mmetsp:Transcript_130243/g.291269  ORF Transcript_130243/g.291269 Transcript_130243/m.291269 type:complete len:275 (-) Transcript_130243:1048-1872(-)